MNFSAYLIDEYRAAKGYRADKHVAADISVSQQYLSRIRAGEKHLTEEQAIQMAKACGIVAEVAVAGIAGDKSKHKELWEGLLKKLMGAALTSCGLALTLTAAVRDYAQCNGNSDSYGILAA